MYNMQKSQKGATFQPTNRNRTVAPKAFLVGSPYELGDVLESEYNGMLICRHQNECVSKWKSTVWALLYKSYTVPLPKCSGCGRTVYLIEVSDSIGIIKSIPVSVSEKQRYF